MTLDQVRDLEFVGPACSGSRHTSGDPSEFDAFFAAEDEAETIDDAELLLFFAGFAEVESGVGEDAVDVHGEELDIGPV